MVSSKTKWLALSAVIVLVLTLLPSAASSQAQGNSRTFPETGHTVSGRFLEYWNTHGGLAQQGYPISEASNGVSATNGQTYKVQYFERAVFELHPETPAPFNVLLSLLGVQQYQKVHNLATPTSVVVPPTNTPAVVSPTNT